MLGLSSDEWTAIELSLRVSIVAMLVSLPFGIGAALLLARGRFWGKSILNGLIHLPLILPPVVTGFILLVLFGRKGPIGALLEQYLGLVFSFRWTGAALACGVMGFPLMVRSIRLSVEAVDRKLEEAAGTLGARPIWTFVTVTLRARPYDEHFVLISVQDTGYGIAPEDRAHIFERFYQANHHLQSRMGGNGLGLSIAKLIVEQHGGQINFESAVNEGTTFYFTVPLYIESPPQRGL